MKVEDLKVTKMCFKETFFDLCRSQLAEIHHLLHDLVIDFHMSKNDLRPPNKWSYTWQLDVLEEKCGIFCTDMNFHYEYFLKVDTSPHASYDHGT